MTELRLKDLGLHLCPVGGGEITMFRWFGGWREKKSREKEEEKLRKSLINLK
jgi:hypothetical protein